MDNFWGQALVSLIVLVLFVAVLVIIQYIRNYKGLKKQREHFKELHANLKVGDEVIFSNGMYGKVTKIHPKEDLVDIAMKNGEVTVSRYVISDTVNK